jgi:hypothetical protein
MNNPNNSYDQNQPVVIQPPMSGNVAPPSSGAVSFLKNYASILTITHQIHIRWAFNSHLKRWKC